MVAAILLRTGLVGLVLVLLSASGAGTSVTAVRTVPAPSALSGAQLTSFSLHLVNSNSSAGWEVPSVTNGVTIVKGDWKVSGVKGSCPSSTRYEADGIFITGTSGSYVGLGTITGCQSGGVVGGAFFLLGSATTALALTLHVGDHMRAELYYLPTSHSVRYTLADLTTHHSVVGSSPTGLMHLRTAAWFVDSLFVSGWTQYPLLDFGKVTFANCSATVNGTSHPIGKFANATAVSMFNVAGTGLKALESALSTSGKSFTVTWKSKGP